MHECDNQRITRRIWKGGLTTVRDLGTPGGRAAALEEAVKKDDLIIEYVGETVGEEAMKEYEASKGVNDPRYAMRLSKSRGVYIIAEHKGNAGSFINHSCTPNVRAERWTAEGEQRIGIFANTDLRANTVVGMDYKMVRGVGMRCWCGAPGCRKTIGGESDGQGSGDSGRSSDADGGEAEDLWTVPKPKRTVHVKEVELASAKMHTDLGMRRTEMGMIAIAMQPNGHCQFESMSRWMTGGAGYETALDARRTIAGEMERKMKTDHKLRRKVRTIRGLSHKAYVRDMKRGLHGDVLTLQAFCDDVGAETTIWDPIRSKPAVNRGVGIETADPNRRFVGEHVAATGRGELNHYNVWERGGEVREKADRSEYTEMKDKLADERKLEDYNEWVERKGGKVKVTGKVGEESATGTGDTKKEARENMARAMEPRLRAGRKRQREDSVTQLRQDCDALLRRKKRRRNDVRRGRPTTDDDTGGCAAELAKALGDGEDVKRTLAQKDDFGCVRDIEVSSAEMTAIMMGEAKHLVTAKRGPKMHRAKSILWVNDGKRRALIRVGETVRLHKYETWERALTKPEQWASKRVFERAFKCEPSFDNMAKQLGIEWFRGARAPILMKLWPVDSAEALDELIAIMND